MTHVREHSSGRTVRGILSSSHREWIGQILSDGNHRPIRILHRIEPHEIRCFENVLKRLDAFWDDGVPEEIIAAGGVFEDAEVVVDGNLVTSRWPPDLPDFMRELMTLVESI
jgi:putative intracellular protease/amidase